jgi:hypothetical protein
MTEKRRGIQTGLRSLQQRTWRRISDPLTPNSEPDGNHTEESALDSPHTSHSANILRPCSSPLLSSLLSSEQGRGGAGRQTKFTELKEEEEAKVSTEGTTVRSGRGNRTSDTSSDSQRLYLNLTSGDGFHTSRTMASWIGRDWA